MESTTYTDIFQYITAQETMYRKPIPINEKWNWSMYEHIKLSTLYKYSQLSTGKDDFKPVRNITRPILNLQYRAEGFDVKDIKLYVDDPEQYYKSFLIQKYHEKWARENEIDNFIDEMVESYVDYGAGLVKDVDNVRPEVVALPSIAFCDQTDLLSGPIGIVHYFSPDQLLDMADKGWGNTSKGATATLEDTIKLSRETKQDDQNGTIAETPGRYIKVYEVHGNLPKRFSNPKDTSGKYETRLYIVCFYQKPGSGKQGIILYTGPEKKSPFRLIKRDAIFGRALGFGGAEELFEAQVWVNYDMIRMQAMLDSAAKTIMWTDDPAFVNKNKVRDMENLETLTGTTGSTFKQVDTFPRNFQLFEKSLADWQEHAREMGSATGALLGEVPTNHTAFNSLSLATSQGQAIHDYRKGKLATFLDTLYREWIIPHIVTEIEKGQEFLADLDTDELQAVADALVNCQVNYLVKEQILSGQIIDPSKIAEYEQQVRDEFMKGGNKRFIKLLKKELKSAPVDVKTDIANKNKDLAGMADKVTKLMGYIMGTFNPQTGKFAAFEDPRMVKLTNEMFQALGFSPVDYYQKPQPAAAQPQMQPGGQQPPQPGQTMQPQQQPLQPSPMQPGRPMAMTR